MFETYIPGFSNTLTFQPELTGGGPAYTTITPDFMPEPAEGPAPAAMTPQEEFQARVRQIEAMVPGTQAAQPPSIRPSPSAPPMMSAPGAYVPGFTPMLLNQATPERASMLPFAPEAPARASTPAPAPEAPARASTPAADLGALAGLAINPMFIGTGLSGQPTQQAADLFIDPATGLTLSKPRTVELDETGSLVREITPEGSVPGVYFTDNRGISATAGLGKGARFTPLNPNAVYTVINQRTGEVVSTGTGAEGLKAAQRATAELSKAGRKSDWAVVMNDAATGAPKVVANVDPRPSAFGQFADVALPIAGAFLAPITLGASAALGAAAGSGLSSVAQGRSLENTLLRAAIAAGSTYAGNQLFGPVAGAKAGAKVGSVAGQAAGQAAGKVAGQAIIDAAGNMILPVGGSILGSAAGSAIGAGAGSLLGSAIGSGPSAPRVPEPARQPVQVTPEGEMILTAPTTAPAVPTGGALPFATAGAGALAQPGVDAAINSIKQQIEQKQAEQKPENEIVVRPTDTFEEAFAPLLAPGVGALNIPENEIVVTTSGKAPTSFDKQPTLPLAPTLPDLTKTPVDVQGPKDNRFTLEDIYKYLRAAGLLSSLVGGGGGGGRGGAGTIPSGFGFSSVFSGSLPRATLPGASTGFAPRPQTSRDYYRYGYGPSQSFFSYVPEGERNLSQAYTGYAHGGMAEGGDTFAVNRPGTGRSDEIPAMLSDGEYVIDAETVALLGDGSSKAGAERLDQFRINVRRDKGRKLAKGEFSVNAKRPEHYLKGGRA